MAVLLLAEAESEPASKPCAAVPAAILVAAQATGFASLAGDGGSKQSASQSQHPAMEPRKTLLRTLSELHNSDRHDEEATVVHFSWASNRTQSRLAVETLAASMDSDPVDAWLTGKGRNEAFARKEVAGYLQALPNASHFIATPDGAAAALWQLLPAESPQNELWAGWTRVLQVPLRHWRAMLDLELAYEHAHAAAAAAHGTYYYLSFIGTLPAARGKGYGSLLLRYMTRKADAEGRVCMLEATSERSKALYERHGFTAYDTYRVRPKAPPIFFMIRRPGCQQQQQQQQQQAQQQQQEAEQKLAAAVVASQPASNGTLIGAVHSVATLAQCEQQQCCQPSSQQQHKQQHEPAHAAAVQPQALLPAVQRACIDRTSSKLQTAASCRHEGEQLHEGNLPPLLAWGSGVIHINAISGSAAVIKSAA